MRPAVSSMVLVMVSPMALAVSLVASATSLAASAVSLVSLIPLLASLGPLLTSLVRCSVALVGWASSSPEDRHCAISRKLEWKGTGMERKGLRSSL